VDLAARAVRVAIRPSDFQSDESAALIEFCRVLAGGYYAAGLSMRDVELTIDARTVPPDAALFLARHRLGACRLNVLVDAGSFRRWRTWLWRTRLDRYRRVGFRAVARSACPLLADETATDVLPGTGLQVPQQSAWLLARLFLPDFVTAGHDLDTDGLEAFAVALLDAADRRHDAEAWPTPAMQQDAWLNRRIAICIYGIGELVHELGLDPGAHVTLSELDRLLAAVRALLLERSRALSAIGGILPAIAAASPRHRVDRDKQLWEQRWLHAVRRSATHHRNLVAISPYAVFPRGSTDLRYADLLPLLRHADVSALDGQPLLRRWNAREFNDFHARVQALSAGLCSDYLVAEQP
jgi:hypothetical protein